MKRTASITIILALVAVLLASAALVVSAKSLTKAPNAISAVAPTVIHYQGYLVDDTGTPIDGLVDLQFGLYAAASDGSPLWTETQTNVAVSEGHFAVMLGGVNPLGPADFNSPSRYLQVAVDTGGGYTTLPRQLMGSTPYAFVAESAPWSGLSGVPAGFADDLDDIELENVILVAKSGGHYTSIQAAVDSITDASDSNRYLVWVGPGRYEEQVILKDNVHLVGAGEWLTIIWSTVSNPDIFPPTAGTLQLGVESDVHDLTVINEGSGHRNAAILADDGVIYTNLENVTAVTNGSGTINYGIHVYGENTDLVLDNVKAYAFQGSHANAGIQIAGGADASLQNGTYDGSGGDWGYGINISDTGSSLYASEVQANADESANGSYGLSVSSSAFAEVHGGQFIAQNAYTETIGISVADQASLLAYSVGAHGSGGDLWINGLEVVDSSSAFLYGGSFRASGGTETYGIINWNSSNVYATGVRVEANSASDRNDAFRNESGSNAILSSCHFYGRGGMDARGLANYGELSVIELNQSVARAFYGDANYGVSNNDNGSVHISNSQITGSSSTILNDGTDVDSYVKLTSLIGGGVSGSGTTVCLGVTYGSSFYADTCP